MRTLSHLIEEAEERFEKEVISAIKLESVDDQGKFLAVPFYYVIGRFQDFLKTELQTIVKESFKNTRVEEIPDPKGDWKNGDPQWWDECGKGYNEALSDKQEMENQFLNN